MKLDLYINEANDYARDIRVPVLLSVIRLSGVWMNRRTFAPS